jgi:phosphohistidine phosphatase
LILDDVMQRVILIRHAEAEEAVSGDDASRRLTTRGRERMVQAARGLRGLADDLSIIAHSPLVRAVETAAIVAHEFAGVHRQRLELLLPGSDPAQLLSWVGGHDGTAVLVGHEPLLSSWIGYVVSGTPRSIVRMKKSAACLLEIPPNAAAGQASILWLMTWRQLASLSRTTGT